MSLATRDRKAASKKVNTPKKNFCEFFAGIGLVREGLISSGWECIYANDNDPKKQELYQARFEAEHFHLEDVRATNCVLSEIIEAPTLATASFPCIDLSLAGHGRGLKGDHSSTFFGFADVIEALNQRCPKLLLIENVNGLLTSHNGTDFQAIAQRLAALGYHLDSFVIDAKHFVPQSRQRVFIIGIHKSVISRVDAIKSDGTLFDPWNRAVDASASIRPVRLRHLMESTELETGWVATPIKPPTTKKTHLRDFLDLDSKQEWWAAEQVERHYRMMSDLHRPVVDQMLADKKSTHVGTIYRRKRYGSTKAEVRFDGIAGCLRVPRGGSARQIVIVIDKGNLKIRWMSPVEYARLQGAPHFPLVGRPNQQMSGFGDAVCVPVIEWIDRHVLTPLYESIA